MSERAGASSPCACVLPATIQKAVTVITCEQDRASEEGEGETADICQLLLSPQQPESATWGDFWSADPPKPPLREQGQVAGGAPPQLFWFVEEKWGTQDCIRNNSRLRSFYRIQGSDLPPYGY